MVILPSLTEFLFTLTVNVYKPEFKLYSFDSSVSLTFPPTSNIPVCYTIKFTIPKSHTQSRDRSAP
jgi:hypothetical protein